MRPITTNPPVITWWLLIFLSLPLPAIADGSSIGKIYKPYVQPLEKEFETSLISQWDHSNREDNSQLLKLGYGQAISDIIFLEGSAFLEGNDFRFGKVEGYEFEIKIQLSEQGEFDQDFGVLFEFEREKNGAMEMAGKLILARDFSRYTALANFGIIYEKTEDKKKEIETEFSARLSYRHSALIEPNIEMFLGQSTQALGPGASGSLRIQNQSKLLWEISLLHGFGKETPDTLLKLNLEYEFL